MRESNEMRSRIYLNHAPPVILLRNVNYKPQTGSENVPEVGLVENNTDSLS